MKIFTFVIKELNPKNIPIMNKMDLIISIKFKLLSKYFDKFALEFGIQIIEKIKLKLKI
jgi:hypothetical protein